jgi:hypothetical protein
VHKAKALCTALLYRLCGPVHIMCLTEGFQRTVRP